MSIAEEIAHDIWNNHQFKVDILNLIKISLRYDYKSIINDSDINIDILDDATLIRLFQSIAIFSEASDAKYHNMAQRICCALLKIFPTNQAVQDIFLLIQSRLRNFPAIRSTSKNIFDTNLPIPLKLEFNKTKLEQTIKFNNNNNNLELTKFQLKTWNLLNNNDNISISAPTSAGKSYVLLWYIISRLFEHNSICIIYIVPTRALINQIFDDVTSILKQCAVNDLFISTIPKFHNNKKVLYILTQERLESLLITNNDIKIDIVIIDESQMISFGSRGILLEAIIDRIICKSNNTKFIFSGPLIENPNFFSKLLKYNNLSISYTAEPNVVQNLIFLDYKRASHDVIIKTVIDNNFIEIGNIKIKQNLISNIDKVTMMATMFGKSGSSIIYSNGKAESEKIAFRLSQNINNNVDGVSELIKFVKRHIHKDYILAETLKKGVAFHYGNMPSLLRKELEDFFKSKKISYLICTSTLLYGVNLPAKNIFLLKPTKGHNSPLDGNDFWNLAGRAGRLGKELEGNIFIINYDTWNNDVIHQTKQLKLDSALKSAMQTDFDKFIEFLDNSSIPSYKNITYETALGKLVLDCRNNMLESTISRYLTDTNKKLLRNISKKIGIISSSLELPTELIDKNMGISLFRQVELLQYFYNLPKDYNISHLIPSYPLDDFDIVRKNYIRIFKIIDYILLNRRNKQYLYYSTLALRWMRGEPLPKIIDSIIKYKKKNNTFTNLASIIRNTMADIEDELRYKYVKLFSVYNSILSYFFNENKMGNYVSAIPDIPLFLEMGGSSITMINMLALGLSRISSEALLDFMPDKDMSIDEITDWIKNTPLHHLDISNICLNEIKEIFKIPLD